MAGISPPLFLLPGSGFGVQDSLWEGFASQKIQSDLASVLIDWETGERGKTEC